MARSTPKAFISWSSGKDSAFALLEARRLGLAELCFSTGHQAMTPDAADRQERRILEMAKSITGRCFCGAVRFQCSQPPIAARACWCRDCQYLSSGNASINAIFRTETIEITGGVNEYVSTADSGNVMRRSFCPKCGTQLFSASLNQPDLMIVRVGALDDPEIFRPTSFIWTASAPGWGLLDRDLPNCEGQPAAPASK